MKQENSIFIDEMFETLLAELKEELGLAMFKRYEDGYEI